MKWKKFLSFLFIILVVLLLGMYWFVPNQELEFFFAERNYNFSVGNLSGEMQFYDNMRFPTKDITYRIEDCTIQKESEMERAFEIIENETSLNFDSVSEKEQIHVTCDSKTKLNGALYIAGEGGPSNITKSGEFNVIEGGKILLIRESRCDKPIVPLHELLHVLGFNHSQNENNIMYPVSKCKQTIGQDILDFIEKIYGYPGYSDLFFEDASASRSGTYLNINFTVRNGGLNNAENSSVVIYADDSEIKRFEVEEMGIGEGRNVILSNIFSLKRNINEMRLELEYGGSELSKENNVALLEIKNN